MSLAGIAALAVGATLVTLAVNLTIGWDIDAICPGSETFCASPWWRAVVDYLPGWLFLCQLVVALVLGSPFAIMRGRG